MSGLVIAHSYTPILITGNNLLALGNFYTCADSGGSSTQTLPSATGSNLVIVIENTGTGTLVATAQSAQTINGSPSQSLGQYHS